MLLTRYFYIKKVLLGFSSLKKMSENQTNENSVQEMWEGELAGLVDNYTSNSPAIPWEGHSGRRKLKWAPTQLFV